MLTVTPIYLALAVVLYSALSFAVIRGRWRHRVRLGEGDNTEMQRLVRAHGNFAEYAPLTLLCIGAAELAGAPAWSLHAAGVLLLMGRVLHGYCFVFTRLAMRPRVTGMVLTLSALWLAAASGLLAVL